MPKPGIKDLPPGIKTVTSQRASSLRLRLRLRCRDRAHRYQSVRIFSGCPWSLSHTWVISSAGTWEASCCLKVYTILH